MRTQVLKVCCFPILYCTILEVLCCAQAAVSGGSDPTNPSDFASAPVLLQMQEALPVQVSLISTGAVWNYNDTRTDPGTTWQAPQFNDAGWFSGLAQLGFGDGDEATMLSSGPLESRLITAYFRHAFLMNDASTVQALTARLTYDDGAVVYLNGVEAFRANMPAGSVNYSTLATSTLPDNALATAALPPGLLVNGTNVVVVEVHQVNAMSTDLSFALELLADIGTATTNQPPTVELLTPGGGTTFFAGTNILLRAAAADADGSIAQVECFAGAAKIGESVGPYGTASGSWILAWTNVPVGQYSVTARATDNGGATATSAPVLVTMVGAAPPLRYGVLRWEVYTNIPGMTLADLTNHPSFPDNPALVRYPNLFEAPEQFTENFGARLSGFLLPPETGNFIFYLTADDQGALFLSTDDNPAHKTQIAFEPVWSLPRQWVDQSGDPNHFHISAPIRLEAGRRYYIEALMKEGGGGDNLAVAWQRPGAEVPANGSLPIPGEYLATWLDTTNNLPPEVTLTLPADGAVFLAPATIQIEADVTDPDGSSYTVEFFANVQQIGESTILTLIPPVPGSTLHHCFTWPNVPAGSYTLTAQAQNQQGALGISAPVRITVQEPTPVSRELHVVGIYSGTAPGGGPSHSNEQGQASLVINRPGQRVTLFLSSYEPVFWHATVGQGTIIEKVVLAGYYRQQIDGLPAGVEIVPAWLEGRGGDYLWIGYTIESGAFYYSIPKINDLTGLPIASFHGGYQAPYPAPFVIDAVQNDPRLSTDYPQPVPPSQVPSLNFSLAFRGWGTGSNAVRHQSYTLQGPATGSRLQLETRVWADQNGRYYYGLGSSGLWKVDSQTGVSQDLAVPPGLPELSVPVGAAFDSLRQRALLVSLGGEGFLYAYAPTPDQWSLVASMANRDLDNLMHHAAQDALYGVGVIYGDEVRPALHRFSAEGVYQSQFQLPHQPFGYGSYGMQSELVSLGNYIVWLLESPQGVAGSGYNRESRIYLIDPQSQQVWLTYRQVERPPAVQITWPAPAPIVYGTPLGSTQLNATANVPGTFSYSPAVGTVLYAGTHTLTCTFYVQSPSGSVPVITNVSLVVNRAPLTIRADDKTKYRGQLNPPLTAVSYGLVNGDTPDLWNDITFLTTPATPESGPGLYPIDVFDFDPANYIITPVCGTLTVLPARTQPGAVDLSFDAQAGGIVYAITIQPDGRILIGGDFAKVQGLPRNGLARLGPDGHLDTGFGPAGGYVTVIQSIAVCPDGKVMVAGFAVINETHHAYLARLLDDGTRDPAFTVVTNTGWDFQALAVQSDGKALVAGSRYDANGSGLLLRFNTDGSLDTSFNVGTGPDQNWLSAVVVQSDGRILVSGFFSSFNGQPRNSLVRLNLNGSVDPNFQPPAIMTSGLASLALQSDGRVAIGAYALNPSELAHVARLTPDGALDPTFNTIPGINRTVRALAVQPDGRILIGGDFSEVNGVARWGIARLNANGSLDTFFEPGGGVQGPDQWVNTIAVQSSEYVLIGGGFPTLDQVPRPGIARLFAHGGPSAPCITVQPASQTVQGGSTAYFHGEAQGVEPITYQWLFKGNPIPGATTRNLDFLVVSTNQAGGYGFVARNDGGAVTSAVANLTVRLSAPSFSNHPLSQGAVEGGTVVLTASASGNPQPSLQWLFNGQPLLGATGEVLRLDPIRLDQTGNYAAVAANEAGTITSQTARVTVLARGPLDQWTWRRPLPQGNDLYGFAFGNGNFTAVGRAGATVSSSDGGETWRHTSAGNMDLECVAFGNGSFVALGTWWPAYTSSSVIGLRTSADGMHWNEHSAPELNGFAVADVAFGNGRFVAVSYYGRSAVSTDGLHWTVSPQFNWNGVGAVNYGNGLFVATISNDEYTPTGVVSHVAFSTDGLSWTERSLGVPSIVRDITWGNGLFVACGYRPGLNNDGPSAIFTTPDLVSWNTYLLPATNSLVAIQSGGGRFVAVSSEQDGLIVSSPDAVHWTVHRVPLTNGLYALTYGAGRFAAAGNFGNLLTSTNGETWTLQSVGSETNLRGVARGEGGYVAIGNDGLLLTSSNGMAWTPQPRPTSNNLRGVAFGAGRFTAVGEKDSVGGTIFVSSNGATWTRVSSSTNTGLYDIIYAVDRFVAVGDKGTTIVSRDGLTWTTGSSSTGQKLNSIAWGAGIFVAVGKESTIVTSTNGTNWTRSLGNEDGGVFLQAVAYGNGIFVAAGKGGTVLTATNLQWTWQRTQFYGDIEDLFFADGVFMLVGQNGNVATSPDGQVWTPRGAGCANDLRAVIYADHRFTAVGNNETILQSNAEGPASAPAITQQPVSQTRAVGQAALFTVEATGTPPLAYQWRKNGVNLPGATNATLSLSSMQVSNGGLYTVVVTNLCGGLTSTPATLTIVPVVAWGWWNDDVTLSLTNCIALAGGYGHSLGLKADGTVVAWGYNLYGESDVPPGLSDVVAIDAGGWHSVALKRDGTVVAWGDDTFGRETYVPPGLSRVVAVAAGRSHTLALKADRTVVAWGFSGSGQTNVPPGLSEMIAIAAGDAHSLALRADGTVVAWGDNGSGQATVPAGLSNVIAIAAGVADNLVLLGDGRLLGWGWMCDSTEPVVLPGFTNVAALAGEFGHFIALLSDGTIAEWGQHDDGTPFNTPPLSNVVAIAAGGELSLALLGNGAPVIEVQPASRTARVGQTVAFHATAVGTPPLRYQWQYYGTPIVGATNATLTLPNLLLSQGGSYAVSVVNAGGSVISSWAALTLLPVPAGPGALDLTFDPENGGAQAGFGGDYPSVNEVIVQPDGKVLAGGSFTRFNDEPCGGLVRLNPDGSLEARLVLDARASWSSVNALALQADGKILITYQHYLNDGAQSGWSSGLARLNPDLSVDHAFNVTNQWSYAFLNAVAVQADGKVLSGGVFNFATDEPGYRCLARFNADGSVDSSFQPPLFNSDGEPRNAVNNIVVQPDGRIILVGAFSVAGSSASGLVRLLPDGSMDIDFDRNVPRAYTEDSGNVVLEPDGRIVVGADFWGASGAFRRYLVRLNPDGTADDSFQPSPLVNYVRALARLPDGGFLVSTNQWSGGGVVRLRADGSLVESFQVWLGSENVYVAAIAVQTDGQAVIGGRFDLVNGYRMPCLARLNTGAGGSWITRELPAAGQSDRPCFVQLEAAPAADVNAYAVEDQPPAGWSVSDISHGGVFDPRTGKVKFGPFFDALARTLNYEVLPPSGARGVFSFTGQASADGVNSPINGDQQLVVAGFHPADRSGSDWLMTMNEMTAYATAWRRGENWPAGPVPIPMNYVTRAAMLWRGGECYTVDRSVTNDPLWWMNCGDGPIASPAPMSLSASAEISAARNLVPPDYVPGETITVQINAAPLSSAQAYAVEDQPPRGWTVSAVSHGGVWDAVSRRVKWGPFLDSAPRPLNYQATPPADASGIADFTGLASFDGRDAAIAGAARMREICWLGGGTQVAEGRFQLTLVGRMGARIEIQVSSDLAVWTPLVTLTNTPGRLELRDPAGLNFRQRFYRAKVVE